MWPRVELQIDMSSSRDVVFALEHNASSLPSVKVQEWHRPYWPWIRHQSSLSHTSSLIPLLLISAPRTCTFQNNSFEMYWLYAELVSDTHLLLTDIHPCLTHTHTHACGPFLGDDLSPCRKEVTRLTPLHNWAHFRARQAIDWPDKHSSPLLTFEMQRQKESQGELSCV